MPPSLVKFNSSTRGDNNASCTSTPSSDHVPELRYAQLWLPVFCDGTPATAEPVSCAAGAITFTPERPVRAASAGRSGPTREPGGTISGNIFTGKLNFSSNSVAHARFFGFTHWLVVAMVNSQTRAPQRQKFKKSGVNN